MKSLKEIVIFLVIGIILILLDNISQDEKNKIQVDDQLLTQLSQSFELQFGRLPTDEELTNLLITWYEDEIIYQEALDRGFDNDDEIIRRRLIQKYSDFIKTKSFDYIPTNEELRNFYSKNINLYKEPAKISFTHKFFKKKNDLKQDIFFSGNEYIMANKTKIDKDFGEGFFKLITEQQDNKIQSIYGWHEIENLIIYPENIKNFEEVQNEVFNDFMFSYNSNLFEENILEISKKYELIFK